jgi:hypothetical protein
LRKQNIFSYTCVPRRRILVAIALSRSIQTHEIVSEGIGMNIKAFMKSKILTHFIKGKVYLSPMETIIMIPSEQ